MENILNERFIFCSIEVSVGILGIIPNSPHKNIHYKYNQENREFTFWYRSESLIENKVTTESFSKTFILPDEYDGNTFSTRYVYGILTFKFDKSDEKPFITPKIGTPILNIKYESDYMLKHFKFTEKK